MTDPTSASTSAATDGADRPAAAPLAPPAWARRCAGCGYDLHATPGARACPECGEPCDARSLVVIGRRAVGSTSIMMLVVGSNVMLQSFVHREYVYGLAGLALVAVTIALRIRNLRLYGGDGSALLLVDARGIAQRRGYGPVRIVPWSRIRTVKFRPVHRWRWSRVKPVAPAWYLAFGPGPLPDPSGYDAFARKIGQVVMPTAHVIFEADEADARAVEEAAYAAWRKGHAKT